MAAKNLVAKVKRDGAEVIDADETGKRLLTALTEYVEQFSAALGVETVQVLVNNKQKPRDKVVNPLVVHPEIKAGIVHNLQILESAMKSDRKISNPGREVKADIPALQRMYVEYRRNHPSHAVAIAAMNVAVKYNSDRDESAWLNPTYVQNKVKSEGWEGLISIPSPEPVSV